MGFFNLNFLKSKAQAQNTVSAPLAFINNSDGFEGAAPYSRDRSIIYTPDAERLKNPSSYTRNELLRMSRYLVNNYALAERILSVSETYAIGASLSANAATPDTGFNDEATKYFNRWADSAFCSVNNQTNFAELQKIAVRELVLANEVFIVLIKLPSGYPQLMLVPSERVRHSGDVGDTSVDGLYCDSYGKVTAYNIFTGPDTYQKIDSSNVIHLMRHKQAGQLRGVAGMAASINSMRDTKDVLSLHKKTMKAQSVIALAITKKGGDAGPGGLLGGGVPIAGNGSPATGPTNRRLESPFAGASIFLNEGEDIKLLASENTSDNFLNFCEMLTRETCLNIGLPFEFAVNPSGLNGTSMRFVISDADAYFRDLQDRMIHGALDRIYAYVISCFIKDPKHPLRTPTADFLPWACNWTRPVKVTIDQGRNDASTIAMMQNSLITFETHYGGRGKDWKAELRQRAAEEKFLNELAAETGVDINRLRALTAGAMPIPGEVPETETTPAKKAA